MDVGKVLPLIVVFCVVLAIYIYVRSRRTGKKWRLARFQAVSMIVRNFTRERVIGDAIRVADRFFPRMRGLLRTDELAEGEGLWIHPCSSIHSIGMRFEFDAVFLGPGMKVVGRYEWFRRNRISRVFWSARGVLELPAGTIGRTGTEVGDEIQFEK